MNALKELRRSDGGAGFAPGGQHRTYLYRMLSNLVPSTDGRFYVFVGINPSYADEENDDATVRKLRGFVTRWGGCGFGVINAFTRVTSDVRELSRMPMQEAVGPWRSFAIHQLLRAADVIVPCWGNRFKLPPDLRPHLAKVSELLAATGKPLRCFGYTLNGDPRHPLMISYATPLVPYPPTSRKTSPCAT